MRGGEECPLSLVLKLASSFSAKRRWVRLEARMALRFVGGDIFLGDVEVRESERGFFEGPLR